jgi:hypothetical protein
MFRMLPFLAAKNRNVTVIDERGASGERKSLDEAGKVDEGIVAAAEDILSAIASKDATALAKAMQACHEICSYSAHEGEAE